MYFAQRERNEQNKKQIIDSIFFRLFFTIQKLYANSLHTANHEFEMKKNNHER